MSTVAEIEAAITHLPVKEAELSLITLGNWRGVYR
jgi:hypothetical protein